MADVTVDSATLDNGTLTIIGTGFTRTTTIVEIDGNQVPFDSPSDTLITVSNVADTASEVDVTKGAVTASATIVTEVPNEESNPGAPADPSAPVPVPVDEPIAPKIEGGGHLKPADMRKEVEGKPLEDLSKDPDSARAPYPQGSPRDPEDIFEEQHGFRKGA